MESEEGEVIQIDESILQGQIKYSRDGLHCDLWIVEKNAFLDLSERKQNIPKI